MTQVTEEYRLPGRVVQAKVFTAVNLNIDQAARLRQLAAARGVPVTHLLRVAIDRLLATELGEL
jgi:hypothetical protein